MTYLINPFEEVVVFGKAYRVVDPVPSSTTVRALVPTGGHVGHGNALGHYRGPKSGGPATRLERYTGPRSGGRVHGVLRATGGRHGGKKSGLERYSGPHSGGKQPGVERFRGPHAGGKKPGLERYSKGLFRPKKAAQAAEESSAAVQRGLEMIGKTPKPKEAPRDYWGPAGRQRGTYSEGPSRTTALENYKRLQKSLGGTTGTMWTAPHTVQRGLEMVARTPKPKKVPSAPRTAGRLKTARIVQPLRAAVARNN